MDGNRERPSNWSIIVLVIAAVACIATSPEEDLTGSVSTIWFTENPVGDGARVELQIHPVENRLELSGLSGAVFLNMRMIDVPEALAPGMRWTLSGGSEGGEIANGDFTLGQAYDYLPVEGEGGEGEGAEVESLVEAYVQLGQICPKDGADGTLCLPCELETGCTLTVDIDACLGDGNAYLQFAVVDQYNATGNIFCDGLQEPDCKALDGWVSLAESEGPEVDCSEEADEGTDEANSDASETAGTDGD